MTSGTILNRPLGQAVALVTTAWGVIALVAAQLGSPIPGEIIAGVTTLFGAILTFIAGGESARTAAAVEQASTTSSATVTVTAPNPTAVTPPSITVVPPAVVPPSSQTPPKP